MSKIASFARSELRPLSVPSGHWLKFLIASVALLVILCVANLMALAVGSHSTYTIDAGGYGDQLILKGFFAQEKNEAEETYRWTSRSSSIELRGAALAPHVLFDIRVGGLPAQAGPHLPVALSVNGQSWGEITVEATPRHYWLLVPSDANDDLVVGLESDVVSSPDDPRLIGLRFDNLDFRLLGAQVLLPPLKHLLFQALTLLFFVFTLTIIGLDLRWVFGLASLVALLLGMLQSAALPIIDMYLPRVLGVCITLAFMTCVGLPLARRYLLQFSDKELRWLWIIVLAACAVRMLAMLYPPFATHDVGLNLRRLDAVSRGILVLIAPSAEFAGSLTIYPPAPYIALFPTYLLTASRPLVLFAGLALLDGTTTIMLALLAMRLRLSTRSAIFAAALYAGSSLSFTALWWGFTAQVFGQWFTVPLAIALISTFEKNSRTAWIAAWVCFQIALLSHAGVAVLAVAWVTLSLLIGGIYGRMSAAWWKSAIIFYVSSGIMAIILLYADVLVMMIQQAMLAHETASEKIGSNINILFWRGLMSAYTPLGLVLGWVGLLLFWRRLERPGPWAVLLAWVATLLIFVAVDLIYGLIVRHFYFALPLVCVAAAYVLSLIAQRSPRYNRVSWILVVLFCLNGFALWWFSVVEYAKPSMTPLTH